MGLEIEIGLLTLIMFGSLLVLLMAGLPLAFVTGGVAVIFLFILGDADTLNIVAPSSIPMSDIFKSALPFLAIQLLGLTILMMFPKLITWLPGVVYG